MVCKERKEAFVVHASTYEAAVTYLTLEQMGELFVKLGRFHFKKEDVHSDDKDVDIILRMAKPVMNSASRRYQEAVENGTKGKEHGIKGGRPRKGETRDEYDARRLERARSVSEGGENPQKPLDTDIDIDTEKEIDIEIKKDIDVKKEKDIDKEMEIKKKTNGDIFSNSISANSISSFISNLEGKTTKRGEDPRPSEKPQAHACDNTNVEDETTRGEEPRKEERPRQGGYNGSKGSDLLRRITLPDDDEEVPPCPPDARYMNYVGTLQDIIRYDAEPDYSEMTDADMMDAIKSDLDAALECSKSQGKTQRFWDHVHRAKRIYMHLNGCSEEDAKSGISRLYKQRQIDKRG